MITRFGGRRLRNKVFDHCYQKGKWDYLEHDHASEIVVTVEKYANKGCILDMGCGPGILATLLSDESFEMYMGVDGSSDAIHRASKRSSEKIHFKVGDFQHYECKEQFDVILFEESLYYAPFRRRSLLMRFAKWLKPSGVFIVTVSDPKRFFHLVEMIRKNFKIVEDKCFENLQRVMLVFRVHHEPKV